MTCWHSFRCVAGGNFGTLKRQLTRECLVPWSWELRAASVSWVGLSSCFRATISLCLPFSNETKIAIWMQITAGLLQTTFEPDNNYMALKWTPYWGVSSRTFQLCQLPFKFTKWNAKSISGLWLWFCARPIGILIKFFKANSSNNYGQWDLATDIFGRSGKVCLHLIKCQYLNQFALWMWKMYGRLTNQLLVNISALLCIFVFY